MEHRFSLKPDVNRVRVGSIVVDENGYSTQDELEAGLLDAHPDLVHDQVKLEKAAKKTKKEPVA